MSQTHKKLTFGYESIGNLCRLLVDIMIEKSNNMREITVYHERFGNEPDDIYERFLTELYPDGCTISEKEINALTAHIRTFMSRDEKSQDLFIKYDMRHSDSYVFFKIDKTLTYAPSGSHAKIIQEICCDYFKDVDIIDSEKLRRFVLENFTVKSANSTIETIADSLSRDYNYLMRELIMYKKGEFTH